MSKMEKEEKDDEEVIAGSEDYQLMVANVPHRSYQVCGVIKEVFTITAPSDDSLKRDLAMYELFNEKDTLTENVALFVRTEAVKKNACETFLAHYDVLRNAEGSVHLPTLTTARPMKKLYFGMDNIQQSEHDADWRRPAMIVKLPSHCVFLVSMRTLSPTGNVETGLALAVGYGMVTALSSLHDKGFIHRFVTPWNFMVPMPFTMDSIAQKMLIMDLSLASRWRPETTSDAAVRFAGTLKYSSLRALNRRTVGPADDFISVIYIVAELISGKIPWRSVSKMENCVALRQKFTDSAEFGRLPREIRRLYVVLCKTLPADKPVLGDVRGEFEAALKRRVGNEWRYKDMPEWLDMPTD